MRSLSPGYATDILNALTAHIALLDAQGRIIAVNDAWRQFAGSNGGNDDAAYVGTNYLEVCQGACGSDSTAGVVASGLRDVLSGAVDRFAYEYPCHSPTEQRWFIARITPCGAGADRGAIVAHENITQRRLAEDEARRASVRMQSLNRELAAALERERTNALTDELTGVGNRRHLFAIAEELRALAVREGRALSLLLVDIDHFKQINDRHGHQAGDRVLRRVAASIRQPLRASDVVARYGGEEFVVVLPDADLARAREVAERIRTYQREQTVRCGDADVTATLSVGVSGLQQRSLSLEDLIREADRALYRAKDNGRDRVEAWVPADGGAGS